MSQEKKGEEKRFYVSSGEKANVSETLTVKDGIIVKYERETYHYLHNCRSLSIEPNEFHKEISLFTVCEFCKKYLERKEIEDYKKFISNLDKSMLDKYFEASYLPKKD